MSTRRLSILSILAFALVASGAASSVAGEVSFGAKAGLLTSNVTGTPEGWEDAKSYRTTFAGGVVLNYAFNEAFSLEPELLYFSKGFVANLYEGFVNVDVTARFDYVELPVLAKYTFLPGRKFRPCVFAGPSFIYSIASELELSAGIFSGSADVSSLTHTTDFGAILGAGFGCEAGDGTLTFEVRYQRGFTNVVTTGDFEINGSTRTIAVDDFKNYGFAFLVGYRL
jgi:hypothetical protein